MKNFKRICALATFSANLFLLGAPVAADAAGSVSAVSSFIKSLVQALAGLAGIIAAGFFVVGGLRYITSSGNPHHLEGAKRTILFAAVGLAVTIAAYVLSDIVGNLAASAFGGSG